MEIKDIKLITNVTHYQPEGIHAIMISLTLHALGVFLGCNNVAKPRLGLIKFWTEINK